MTDAQPTTLRRSPGRSPSYPTFSIDVALARAQALYEEEQTHSAPIETIARHWGYKGLSGPSATAIAALKKYGLLADEGSGTNRLGRLTDLAINALRNPDENERQAAIWKAAMTPPIHQEMWSEYGLELPSDDNLKWKLEHDRGFTERGAAEFVSEYRRTIAFVQPPEDGSLGGNKPDGDGRFAPSLDQVLDGLTGGGGQPPPPDGPPAPEVPGMTTQTFNLIDGQVVIQSPTTMTEDGWNQFMAILTALKPSFLKDRPDPHYEERGRSNAPLAATPQAIAED